MRKNNMRRYTIVKREEGFILLSTMVVLLFMMIIALGTYRQAVLSTKTLGMSRFKTLASTVTEDVLNHIESDHLLGGALVLPLCDATKPSGEANTCHAPSSKAIDGLREAYLSGVASSGSQVKADNVTFLPYDLENVSNGLSSTTNMAAYYVVQKVGEDGSNIVYRTTIISFVLDNMDVIESGFRAKTP